jgi:hypothetical protein
MLRNPRFFIYRSNSYELSYTPPKSSIARRQIFVSSLLKGPGGAGGAMPLQ